MRISRRQIARQIAGLAIIPLILGALLVPTSAGRRPVTEVQRKAKPIFEAMLKEREKFTSGVAEISGTKLVQFTGQPDVKGPISGLYAFKVQGDRLRYDIEEPYVMFRDKKPILMRRRFCAVRNPEYSAWWSHDRNDISIVGSGKDPLEESSGTTRYVQALQAAGMLDYIDFEMGRSLTKVVENLLHDGVTSVTQVNGQAVLEWRLGDDGESGSRRLVIEMHEGYRPVELTFISKRNPAKSVTKTKWQKVGGVDVPVEMTIEWDYTDDKSVRHSHYTLKFDWKKTVNKPVNPVHFDFRSFRDIPGDGSIEVYDHRRGPTNLGGIWKGNGVVERRPDP